VAGFLGQAGDATVIALAETHLPLVTAFVRAYTGGRGFNVTTGDPSDDVGAVIIAAAARLTQNPTLTESETIGAYSVRYGPSLNGWTLPELAVLHRYRRRTA